MISKHMEINRNIIDSCKANILKAAFAGHRKLLSHSIDKRGGKGIGKIVIDMFYFFMHLCTSNKLNMQHYHLVEVPGYTYMF